MANIANLAVQLTANTGGFTGGLQKANSSLDRFKKQATGGMGAIDKAFAGIPSWGAGLLGVGSAGAVAAVGISKVADAFARIDEVGDQAQMLGASVESLSSLNFAANLLDAESFSSSIEKLSVNLGKAYYEAGTARDAIRDLGLSEKALVNLPIDEQLIAIAKGMENVATEADKSRLTVALFGKSGLDMKNMLGDVDALTAAMAEAKELGVLITEEDAALIGEADAAMKRLKASSEGLANVLAVKVAPAIEKIANGLAEVLSESRTPEQMIGDSMRNAGVARSGDAAFLEAAGLGSGEDAASKSKAAAAESAQVPLISDDMISEAEKLRESLMTPAEKFRAEVERLNEMKQAGAIDSTTFDRASAEYAKERDKDAIRAQEEKQDRIDRILEQSMTPLDEYRAGVEELNMLLNDGSLLPEQYSKSLQHLNDVFENTDPATKERARMRDQMESDGKALVEQTRNPFERFNADLESARQLLDEGLIDQDTFNRAAMASDQSNIQPMRDDYIGRMLDDLDAQMNDAQQRRDLLANTGEFRQVTNTSRLALGGGTSDPQVRALDIQTRQLAFLREIATQTRNNYAMAG